MQTVYPMIGNRYQPVRELGKGGMGVIYAALDRLTGQMVALKLIATAVVHASLDTGQYPEDLKLALSREFQVLASLRHPNIINVLDYGFDTVGEDEQRQPYYTMELLTGSQTILKAGEGQALTFKLNLLIELLQALTYLHRRGILHHDLKPENVLLNDQGQVKVLDFGISIDRNQTDATQETMGTLAYMAPEVLTSQIAAEPSDLYAVGVIAYEVLTGRFPFDTRDLSTLVEAIIRGEPDLQALHEFETYGEIATDTPTETREAEAFQTVTVDMPVDTSTAWASHPDKTSFTSLTSIIGRLLAKNPQDRYQDARDVIRDLCAAGSLPLPAESSDIRDSFLQAAQFIGREAEFRQLQTALKAMFLGTGSGWLVAGESGIGKSRLLDELRTHALIQGAWVIRGQAVEGGGLL
ncbi:MAG: serine/threonine-protein kinase PknK, partial [Anaerolineae bacterium]|nr:serine/threonine-protein kinase PknK [Anaerolineae bacterium]